MSQSHNTQQEGGDELKQLWFIVHIRIDSQAPRKVFRTTIQKNLCASSICFYCFTDLTDSINTGSDSKDREAKSRSLCSTIMRKGQSCQLMPQCSRATLQKQSVHLALAAEEKLPQGQKNCASLLRAAEKSSQRESWSGCCLLSPRSQERKNGEEGNISSQGSFGGKARES